MCHVYRWASSLDLKQSNDLAATISGIVRGKNYTCLYRVLEEVLFLLFNLLSVGFGRYAESMAKRQW